MSQRKHPAGDAEGVSTVSTVSTSSSWAEYVQRHLDLLGWDNATLSHTAKIDRSLISRWLNDGNQPTVPSIRAVARAFGRDIREALVSAGVFTEQEMLHPAPTAPDMRLLSDDELLREVRRRMRRRHGGTRVAAEAESAAVEEQLGVDVGEVDEDGGDLVEEPESPPESGRDRGQKAQAQQRV